MSSTCFEPVGSSSGRRLYTGPYLGTLRPWAQEIFAPPPPLFVRIQLCSVKFPNTVNQFNNTCNSTRYQHCFSIDLP